MTPENACFDEPSSTDYEYSEIYFWSTEDAKEVKFLPRTIFNQWAEAITGMACSRYGMTHIVNAQNLYVSEATWKEFTELNPKPYWLAYLEENPSARRDGATLQSALTQFKNNGLITGYAVANSVELMKSALRKGHLIYTWSLRGNWNLPNRIYSEVTDNRTIGHCFPIVGYMDGEDYWIAVNSYGQDNGLFYIPYSLTDTLFTRYAIVDSKDEEAILSYKKRIMSTITIEDARKAYEANLWNWERAKEPITREESAALTFRALQTILAKL